jgi:hypothetical protein
LLPAWLIAIECVGWGYALFLEVRSHKRGHVLSLLGFQAAWLGFVVAQRLAGPTWLLDVLVVAAFLAAAPFALGSLVTQFRAR